MKKIVVEPFAEIFRSVFYFGDGKVPKWTCLASSKTIAKRQALNLSKLVKCKVFIRDSWGDERLMV